jgi:Carboxypeptidase regulatory-like domain
VVSPPSGAGHPEWGRDGWCHTGTPQRDGANTGTKTNGKGAFKLKGVPEGAYKFKVTMNGFQSIVGDVVISNKAKDADLAKVVMKVGV